MQPSIAPESHLPAPPTVGAPEPGADREAALAALRWAADVGTNVAVFVPARARRAAPADFRALSVREVRVELDRLLLGRATDEGLEALRLTGALDVWLPEVAAMVGFGDGEWRHKDVWKHTKQVVWQSVPRLAVRWGALLHDIGKPRTRTIAPNGEVHFFGHSEVGAAMFRKRVGKRLGFEGELGERVHFLILHHLRASQYDGSWTDSAVRRFAREMGEGLTDLLDLSRADITTKRPERRKRGLRQISDLAARIRELQAADARIPPLPKGVGNAIMAAFGLSPSRRIGEIKEALEACIEDGEIGSGLPSEAYVEFLKRDPARFGLG
jgi:poly(A) polymerase